MQVNFGYMGQKGLLDTNFLIMKYFWFKWRYSRVRGKKNIQTIGITLYWNKKTNSSIPVLMY